MIKKIVTSLALAGVIYIAPTVTNVEGISSVVQAEEKRATKRVPAMRNRVYTQLARAQSLADAGDKTAGLAVLSEVKERIDQLNAYEKAMLWNFYGFIYYAADDVKNAALSFEKVVSDVENIPDSLYLSTTYSLAQLSMQQEDYAKALVYLKKWQAANKKDLLASQHVLFAQVYYQDKQYENTLEHINLAIAEYKAKNKIAKEQWLILQRAAYYELKQPANVTKVIEELVKHYEKPQYWVQLAGMYGELGQEKKQLGAMETAWLAGYITKPNEILTLAQLYLFNQLPYKAAKIIDNNIENGVLVASEKNLELMAQAYMLAKEDEKSIPVLIQAAQIADTGKFDEQLAQTYLNLEMWDKAIASAEKALSRGGLTNPGNMHLALGMSYFNLQQFDQSLTAFTAAQGIEATAKTAKQWHKYVNKEKGYHLRLAMINQ